MSRAVDYRETLVTYLNSEDIHAAARSLSISKATLHGRLVKLRKWGVKVPNKKRRSGLSQLEVAQLNSLIKKHKQGA